MIQRWPTLQPSDELAHAARKLLRHPHRSFSVSEIEALADVVGTHQRGQANPDAITNPTYLDIVRELANEAIRLGDWE